MDGCRCIKSNLIKIISKILNSSSIINLGNIRCSNISLVKKLFLIITKLVKIDAI